MYLIYLTPDHADVTQSTPSHGRISHNFSIDGFSLSHSSSSRTTIFLSTFL